MRKIHFKNIELLKVNKYYFSKSETIEASALYENKKVPVIIKVQRFNKNDITKEMAVDTVRKHSFLSSLDVYKCEYGDFSCR